MTSAPGRTLPIGIRSFREIREGGYYYVDKTAYLWRLLDEGKHYVLSRPRLFGKSLLVDTCKELLEGNEALFRGLEVHRRWDWSVRHPVVRLSFGSGGLQDPGSLSASVEAQLEAAERRWHAPVARDRGAQRLAALVESIHRGTGHRVAVLVDDYDRPILDALATPEVARTHRDWLGGLYAVVKDADAHIRFSFFTGVGRFSKGTLFSGLNNVIDITLEPAFSAICGFTDQDLDTVFAPEMEGLDREEVRDRYHGYRWLGAEVYNPVDILLLLHRREFGPYWFETGPPTFLVRTLVERGVGSAEIGKLMGGAELLSAFDVDAMAVEAVLFQTGYLTIVDQFDLGGKPMYRLGYPNREVRRSLNDLLRRLEEG